MEPIEVHHLIYNFIDFIVHKVNFYKRSKWLNIYFWKKVVTSRTSLSHIYPETVYLYIWVVYLCTGYM